MSHEAVPPHPDGDRWDGTRPGACSGERWTTPRELFSRDGGVLASTRVLLLHGWAPSLRVAGLSPVPPALCRCPCCTNPTSDVSSPRRSGQETRGPTRGGSRSASVRQRSLGGPGSGRAFRRPTSTVRYSRLKSSGHHADPGAGPTGDPHGDSGCHEARRLTRRGDRRKTICGQSVATRPPGDSSAGDRGPRGDGALRQASAWWGRCRRSGFSGRGRPRRTRRRPVHTASM